MSGYHRAIDSGEGRGYLDVQQSQQPYIPTLQSHPSSHHGHYSTGRGDPPFPDIDMHLGMIFGMNSVSSPKNMENVPNEMIQRWKFLEDSNTVMQTRNQNLITENTALADQVRNEVNKANELKDKIETLQEVFQQEKEKIAEEQEKHVRSGPADLKEQLTSSEDLVPTTERGVQAWAVCRACQRKLEGHMSNEPTVTITKTELESLEGDMQALRDAVVAREEAWDRAMEREQNYRQQLARLSAEAVTSRHLSESRHSELETVALTLAERESELKATQKDMQTLKKIIVKLGRRQRDLEENFDLGNTLMNSSISEKEQKMVEDIVRRQSSAKQTKQKPRQKGCVSERRAASTPSSQQSSPRNIRTIAHASRESAPPVSALEH